MDSVQAKAPAEDTIRQVCGEVCGLLVEKNRKYGNAALEPLHIFSRASADEQIRARIDDKLSRMMNRQDDEDEDVELDLIGYLVLLRCCRKMRSQAAAAQRAEGSAGTL